MMSSFSGSLNPYKLCVKMVIHIYDGGGREGACNGASPRCSMSMEEHVSLTSKCAEISCLGNN